MDLNWNELSLDEFCVKLPKVELHAHLNGSLSRKTIEELHGLDNPHKDDVGAEWSETMDRAESSLAACFEVFSIAHALTSTPEAVYTATVDVIRDFAEDNVVYLEIRSTPRNVEGLMTKKQYVEAIISGIRDSEQKFPSITVKLLVSVDRRRGYDDAKENIDVAIAAKDQYPSHIVGIDLSGDPIKGNVFVDLLDNCRQAGLKLAIHCGETPNSVEIMDIIKFKPDRLGHCTCIHSTLKGSEELFQALLDSKIPVELCLTSNVKCGTVPNYESHHFKFLREAGHPICISTDDKGVFATTLSAEYQHVAKTFQLSKMDLINLSKSAIHYTFASDEEKEKLLKKFDFSQQIQ